MRKKLLHIYLLFAFLLVQQFCFAGFPIGKYRHIVVVSYIYGSASRSWDSLGNIHAFSNNGKFTSHFFSMYFGYGLSRNVDVFVALPFLSNTYEENSFIQTNSGFGDANIGLTYYIDHFDYSKYLSFTAAAITPMYANNVKPYLGYASTGVEGKFNLSGYSKSGWKNTYYDLQFGARRYTDQLGPTQVFADALFGFPTGYKMGMSFQVDWLKSFSNEKSFNPIDLQISRDFTYIKGGANISYRINPNVSIYVNAYTFLYGKNTGKSNGASVSGIFKF